MTDEPLLDDLEEAIANNPNLPPDILELLEAAADQIRTLTRHLHGR